MNKEKALALSDIIDNKSNELTKHIQEIIFYNDDEFRKIIDNYYRWRSYSNVNIQEQMELICRTMGDLINVKDNSTLRALMKDLYNNLFNLIHLVNTLQVSDEEKLIEMDMIIDILSINKYEEQDWIKIYWYQIKDFYKDYKKAMKEEK